MSEKSEKPEQINPEKGKNYFGVEFLFQDNCMVGVGVFKHRAETRVYLDLDMTRLGLVDIDKPFNSVVMLGLDHDTAAEVYAISLEGIKSSNFEYPELEFVSGNGGSGSAKANESSVKVTLEDVLGAPPVTPLDDD